MSPKIYHSKKLGFNSFWQKYCWSKNNLVKKILVKKSFGQKEFWIKINVGPKNVRSKKSKIRSKKIYVQKSWGSKKIWVQKHLVQNNLGSKKFLVQKIFGNKNFVSNKMLVQKNVALKLYYRPEKLGLKSKVKIGSITAELWSIWTNVSRTVTVDIR